MTKQDKRIAVARDVLEHLNDFKAIDVRQYIRVNDSYAVGSISAELNLAKIDSPKALQDNIDKIATKCEVCLLGACLISRIRLFDKVSPVNMVNPGSCYPVWADRTKVYDSLMSIFNRKQMGLMEAAFECNEHWAADVGVNIEQALAAKHYGEDRVDPKQRIRAVMLNVIRNNGKFIVPSKYQRSAKRELELENAYN